MLVIYGYFEEQINVIQRQSPNPSLESSIKQILLQWRFKDEKNPGKPLGTHSSNKLTVVIFPGSLPVLDHSDIFNFTQL